MAHFPNARMQTCLKRKKEGPVANENGCLQMSGAFWNERWLCKESDDPRDAWGKKWIKAQVVEGA